MRIHTDLDYFEIRKAITESGAPVYPETLVEHRSRTHLRSFELRLSGSGGRNNTGLYGAGDYDGATWDEWGAALAAIFGLDPNARMGGTATNPTYANRDDYHWQTGDRFHRRGGTYLPADTHARHQWEYDADHDVYTCVRKVSPCSAKRPGWKSKSPYRKAA
ncbi:MAG TPA: hypothetical protein VLZ78_04010 [Terrimesophilobacter sp.]|nr:hypothetical protein [Terrimesophilobacter sp.]